MAIWIKPQDALPPQGKKVLWFKKGDCAVVYRFGIYWFPVPYLDSKHVNMDTPDFWADIELPKPYHGKLEVMIDGQMLSIDELEKAHNDIWREIVRRMLKDIKKAKENHDMGG